MRIPSLPFVLPLLAAALLGCEKAENEKGVYWNGTSRPTVQPVAQPTSSSSSSAASSQTRSQSGGSSASTRSNPSTPSGGGGGATAGDAVPFSSLKWSFGGVNGSGAVQSGVVISGLSFSRNGLSFRYNKDLSAWGRSHTHAGDYACLFVQRSDGSWVGGKFDWISSSRTTRDFVNVRGGYHGWSFAGVPNPCNAAFVILNHDCGRRSNVLSGRWTR